MKACCNCNTTVIDGAFYCPKCRSTLFKEVNTEGESDIQISQIQNDIVEDKQNISKFDDNEEKRVMSNSERTSKQVSSNTTKKEKSKGLKVVLILLLIYAVAISVILMNTDSESKTGSGLGGLNRDRRIDAIAEIISHNRNVSYQDFGVSQTILINPVNEAVKVRLENVNATSVYFDCSNNVRCEWDPNWEGCYTTLYVSRVNGGIGWVKVFLLDEPGSPAKEIYIAVVVDFNM